MVELKKYNYFTGDTSSVASGVSQIVDFLDLAGDNYVLFTPPKTQHINKTSDLCLYHFLSNRIEFDGFEDFTQKLSCPSNLFRSTFLVFDFWSLSKDQQFKYLKLIDKIELPSIIVAKEFHYKTGDSVNGFLLRAEYRDLNKSEMWLIDQNSNSQSTLSSLKVAYIRDKKLQHLFGGDLNNH